MQYRYVVVELRDGGSWYLYGDEGRPDKRYTGEELRVLPDLLEQGWTPVREVPVGAASIGVLRGNAQAYCLVLLSKDETGDDV